MNAENHTNKPENFREDAKGRFVPLALIEEIDLYRDETVIALVKQAKDMQNMLKVFRKSAGETINTFLELSLSKWGVVQQSAASKGNLTLRSYDGRNIVKIAIGEVIAFDEQIQAAKDLTDECFIEWGKGANQNLWIAASNAFAVNKEGKIDTRRVLELRNYKIDDPKWKKAMDAITASLTVVASRSYIRFYERDDETGKYKHISLDMASA